MYTVWQCNQPSCDSEHPCIKLTEDPCAVGPNMVTDPKMCLSGAKFCVADWKAVGKISNESAMGLGT